MIRIKDSSAMTDTTPALSKAEAKKLTQKIKTAVDDLWSLLLDAHDRKAWKALGYATWEAYVKAEFDMSRRNSYRLLDQARVVQAIEGNVPHAAQISQRDAEVLKDDLPAVAAEIKQRVDQGEAPEKALEEVAATARAEKEKARAEKAAQQAENDRLREEHAAALPQHIKDREQAKAEWRARAEEAQEVEAAQDRVAELEEAVRALETEAESLRAENKLYREMKVQFEKGGFEKVIADKDEQIRLLKGQVERESQEKVKNLRDRDRYLKILNEKYNHFKDMTIDIETGEVGYV